MAKAWSVRPLFVVLVLELGTRNCLDRARFSLHFELVGFTHRALIQYLKPFMNVLFVLHMLVDVEILLKDILKKIRQGGDGSVAIDKFIVIKLSVIDSYRIDN